MSSSDVRLRLGQGGVAVAGVAACLLWSFWSLRLGLMQRTLAASAAAGAASDSAEKGGGRLLGGDLPAASMGGHHPVGGPSNSSLALHSGSLLHQMGATGQQQLQPISNLGPPLRGVGGDEAVLAVKGGRVVEGHLSPATPRSTGGTHSDGGARSGIGPSF